MANVKQYTFKFLKGEAESMANIKQHTASFL